MRFDKITHKADIETLNKDEAREYIFFLGMEWVRHRQALKEAKFNIKQFSFAPNLVKFYETAKERHEEDITDIDKLSKELKERFGL